MDKLISIIARMSIAAAGYEQLREILPEEQRWEVDIPFSVACDLCEVISDETGVSLDYLMDLVGDVEVGAAADNVSRALALAIQNYPQQVYCFKNNKLQVMPVGRPENVYELMFKYRRYDGVYYQLPGEVDSFPFLFRHNQDAIPESFGGSHSERAVYLLLIRAGLVEGIDFEYNPSE